jgi:hypothetical protein
MSKTTLEEADRIIEEDFKYLIAWSGEEFSENDKKTLENLKRKNRARLKEYLEINNNMMENFKYE